MYQDNYVPQHPMLKQMREEQALMDSLPEPMRISSDVFEISEASKCPKKGMIWARKLSANGEATKAFVAFYKKFGQRAPSGHKDAKEAAAWHKAYNALRDKYPSCAEIVPSDLKKAGLL